MHPIKLNDLWTHLEVIWSSVCSMFWATESHCHCCSCITKFSKWVYVNNFIHCCANAIFRNILVPFNLGFKALLYCSKAIYIWERETGSNKTFCGTVQVTLDKRDKLLVLAEPCIVITVMAETIHSSDVSTMFQQNVHSILTSILAAQNQCCSEWTK